MKKSSADKFSDSSAVVLMLIIGATLNPAGLRTYGEESTSTASARANERTPAPASAIDATIFERPNLTGDWLGARDTLSSHGLTLEISLTQFYQGVVDGGNERDFEYGGKVDYYVNLDGGKAGLWPGFSITTHIETRYGNDVNEIDGMFSLANFNMAFPKGEHAVTGVTALKLTQRLFDHLLLIAGKINTLDDFRLNYTGGNGLDRFMNSAVVANVINGRTIPYSTYGAGFAMFADQGPEFTFLVRDPDHHPTTTDLDKLFAHGALLTGSLRLPVAPFGLPGAQVFGGNWSSRHYTSLDPSDWENVPGQGLPAPEESGSWAIWYNADQTLGSTPPTQTSGSASSKCPASPMGIQTPFAGMLPSASAPADLCPAENTTRWAWRTFTSACRMRLRICWPVSPASRSATNKRSE